MNYDINSIYPFRIKIPEENTNNIQRIFIGTLGDYCVEVHSRMGKDVNDWCVKTFGNASTKRWFRLNDTFIFLNIEDRNWFLLRWSS